MSDTSIVDTALKLAGSNSPASCLFAFLAGTATSIGPCVAPRYAALTIISSGESVGRVQRLGAFVCGTIIVSIALASIGSFLLQVARASSVVYWILAVSLMSSACLTLCRGRAHVCGGNGVTQSAGAAFLFGAGTSMAISPCCAPVFLAMGAMSSASSSAACVVAVVASYTIGHLAPLLLVYTSMTAARKFVAGYGNAVSTVAAAVTMALGLFYAVLA